MQQTLASVICRNVGLTRWNIGGGERMELQWGRATVAGGMISHPEVVHDSSRPASVRFFFSQSVGVSPCFRDTAVVTATMQ